jgi:hypothetical protein
VGYVEDLRGKKQGQGRPRWRARYRDPSGRERSKSFARKVDAEQFLVSIEDAKLRGAYVDPQLGRVLFGEWAERWFRTTADLKPSSRRTYRKLLDNQILPAFERAALGGSIRWRYASGSPGWSSGACRRRGSATPVRCSRRSWRPGWRVAGLPVILRLGCGCRASSAGTCTS